MGTVVVQYNMGASSVAALVVATSLLSSLTTIYVTRIGDPNQQPTVLVVSPDLNADAGATEQFVARALKSIDPDEAEKHFKKARKVVKSWQSGNLALGNDLYKLKLVPGPVGPTGPIDDKFKNTKAGTAKAEKALVVDSNKDINGIRYDFLCCCAHHAIYIQMTPSVSSYTYALCTIVVASSL